MTTPTRRARIAVSLALGVLPLSAVPTVADAASTTATTPTGDGCSPAIRTLQRALDRQHYPVGPIDGCRGPALRAGVQAFQKANGLAPDGVAGPATVAALRTPRPLSPVLRAGGRHLEVDLARQLASVVQDGRVTRIYSVSTGRPGFATPTGTFRVFRKERRSWSAPYRVWMPLASYFTGGVAFHEGGVEQAYSSHGCVHVPASFAPDVYGLLAVGTTVVVH